MFAACQSTSRPTRHRTSATEGRPTKTKLKPVWKGSGFRVPVRSGENSIGIAVQSTWPHLGGVEDAQDANMVFGYPIGHHKRRALDHQFSCPLHSARPTDIRKVA